MIISEPKTLAIESLAAMATAMPPIPSEARRPEIEYPRFWMAMRMARKTIRPRRHLRTMLARLSSSVDSERSAHLRMI